jgi:hypothetical protein
MSDRDGNDELESLLVEAEVIHAKLAETIEITTTRGLFAGDIIVLERPSSFLRSPPFCNQEVI